MPKTWLGKGGPLAQRLQRLTLGFVGPDHDCPASTLWTAGRPSLVLRRDSESVTGTGKSPIGISSFPSNIFVFWRVVKGKCLFEDTVQM